MKRISTEEARRLVAIGTDIPMEQRNLLADERLQSLVEWVRGNSPFFRKKYAALPKNYSLKDLPLTEKSELQANFDDWVTDRSVTLEALTRHLREDEASGTQRLFLDEYTMISTSGSTGVPFTMLRDEYHNRIHGELVAQRLMCRCGDAFSPVSNRIASVIVTKPGVSSYASFLRTQKAAGDYGKNMLAISISSPVEKVVDRLNAFTPTSLTGYPSVLTALAREQILGRLHLKLKAIASSAEMLPEKAFQYISEAFGCPVVNNYCMTEGGEIAMSDGSCPHLHVNDDWILVEPIDQNGNPSSVGQYSDGALITDLSNFICPIIRYRVSDRILLDTDSCGCGSPLPVMKISGRVINCFTLCDSMFFPYGLIDDLMMLDGVVDLQIARVEKDTMEVRLSVGGERTFEQVAQNALSIAQNHLNTGGIREAKLRVTQQMGKNSEKTGKRLVVTDEVPNNV